MNAQHPVHTMPSSGLARPAPQIAAHGPTWANARESDFRIIGEHLRKASQSNKLATHLHAQGLHVNAEQQTKLTHVFLQNALYRIKPQSAQG